MAAPSASHGRRFLNIDQLTKFIQTRETKRIKMKTNSILALFWLADLTMANNNSKSNFSFPSEVTKSTYKSLINNRKKH
jgi:hypothetical protein